MSRRWAGFMVNGELELEVAIAGEVCRFHEWSLSSADNPVAAVSVAAISARLDADRRREVAAVLQRQTRRLAQMLAGLHAAAGGLRP